MDEIVGSLWAPSHSHNTKNNNGLNAKEQKFYFFLKSLPIIISLFAISSLCDVRWWFILYKRTLYSEFFFFCLQIVQSLIYCLHLHNVDTLTCTSFIALPFFSIILFLPHSFALLLLYPRSFCYVCHFRTMDDGFSLSISYDKYMYVRQPSSWGVQVYLECWR